MLAFGMTHHYCDHLETVAAIYVKHVHEYVPSDWHFNAMGPSKSQHHNRFFNHSLDFCLGFLLSMVTINENKYLDNARRDVDRNDRPELTPLESISRHRLLRTQ